MAYFVDDDKIITTPQSYQTIAIDNRKKSIRLTIRDIGINHKLIIERLYINDYVCYVNTSRGNYILNNEDPKLHLVFYNKRWFSVGRDTSLPLIDKSVDRQSITNKQFQNCRFGNSFIQTKTYTTNNGLHSKYYVSDRLLIAARDYYKDNLGCIFVYTKDSNQKYTILEDMISIPYDSTKASFQGNFGSHFELMDMNGYHFLIVTSPNRKSDYSLCSVYVYSYRKRSDDTFYFHHETVGREVVVPRNISIKKLVVTPNKAFHIIYENEIITYYITSTNSQSIKISNPYPLSTLEKIIDVYSSDTHVYALTLTSVTKYSFPITENSLIDLNYISDVSDSSVHTILKDVSDGTLIVSNTKIYFYDQNQNLSSRFDSPNPSFRIQAVDIFNHDSNTILFMLNNGDTYRLINKTTSSKINPQPYTITLDSKIKYNVSDVSSGIISLPGLSDGRVKIVDLYQLTETTIDNYYNNNMNYPEVIVSSDSEKVYIYDRRTKIIHVLLRDPKNEFILSQTIIPDNSVLPHLRFRDTILDIKINHDLSQILIGVKPYNDTKSSVIVCSLNSYVYLTKFIGNTLGFGTSMDIKNNRVIVSDPDVTDVILNGVYYDKGTIDIYNLNNLDNPKINISPLRSTSPIGKICRFSPNLNELATVGMSNNGIHKLTIFGNIYENNYRKIVLNDNISDMNYFLDGNLIISNKDLLDQFYKYQKVNGCFDIITKKETKISELTPITSNISILPLGSKYTFMYYTNQIILFDIHHLKMIQSWSDLFNTNVSVSIDGSTLSYAYQTNNNIEYIICS
jgi:hypothetical protein